jgi:hypothetical protein
MGSTFVTLGRDVNGAVDAANAVGFWMRDGILEVWLRFLALHIEEPLPDDETQRMLVQNIRDKWLLASRICFMGCVPHGLEDATSTELGMKTVRAAVCSLSGALSKSPKTLSGGVLNLMGFSDGWPPDLDFETERLQDVARAFLALLDGHIASTAADVSYMPGSHRR